MDTAGLIGLALVLIFFVVIYALPKGEGIKGAASTIDDLPSQALLTGASLWTITIFRKSGYLHDVREFRGVASDAISKALASCRRSGIYNIIITKNEPAILEFYSANQDGRGKAIGGYRITPAEDVKDDSLEIVDRSENANRLGQLEAQIEDTKRTIAKMLYDGIAPGLSDLQKEVLSTVSEEEIITAISNQLVDNYETNNGQMKFNIPIKYTDKDGKVYDNVALTVDGKE